MPDTNPQSLNDADLEAAIDAVEHAAFRDGKAGYSETTSSVFRDALEAAIRAYGDRRVAEAIKPGEDQWAFVNALDKMISIMELAALGAPWKQFKEFDLAYLEILVAKDRAIAAAKAAAVEAAAQIAEAEEEYTRYPEFGPAQTYRRLRCATGKEAAVAIRAALSAQGSAKG